MKHTLMQVCALLSMVHLVPAYADPAAPYFSIRSQSVIISDELVGWQPHINRCDLDHAYASFYVMPKYSQSFNPQDIAATIFGDDLFITNPVELDVQKCCDEQLSYITISGSGVADRGANDWLADYFGLPTDYQSVLSFKPRVKTFSADLNLYIGFQTEMMEQMYFRIHAPVVWTKWFLNFQETVEDAGVDGYAPGYFSDLAVSRDDLLPDAAAFFTGSSAPTILGSTNDGDMTNPIGSPITFQKLQYSKFYSPLCNESDCSNSCENSANCCNDIVRLSDIEATLGWNFVCKDDYHVGLGIRASVPTGNRPRGEFLFEPIVGSGGHWKLGAQFTSHYIFWRSQDDERSVGFWLDANLQHLFKAKQVRTFDLVDRPNSRYALAQRIGTPQLPMHLAGSSDAGVEWQNEFAPVANLTASSVAVRASIEGNFVAKFAYMCNNSQFDLGFEFWGRSCECICATNDCPSALATNPQGWALKGDAYVIGFENNGSDAPNTFAPIRLAASESAADIHSGTGANSDAPLATNPEIDNPRAATTNSGGNPTVVTFDSTTLGSQFVNSSNAVVFLTADDIEFASIRGISYKLFAHWSHSWDSAKHENWKPFVGIGASGEFAQNDKNCDNPSCADSVCNLGTCQTAALQQWAVWFKGGISFN